MQGSQTNDPILPSDVFLSPDSSRESFRRTLAIAMHIAFCPPPSLMLQKSHESALPTSRRRWCSLLLESTTASLLLSPTDAACEQNDAHACEEQNEAGHQQPNSIAETCLGS